MERILQTDALSEDEDDGGGRDDVGGHPGAFHKRMKRSSYKMVERTDEYNCFLMYVYEQASSHLLMKISQIFAMATFPSSLLSVSLIVG